jgi:hypothetical protein
MINLIHPQSKLQQFLEGFWCIYNAVYFRFDLEDNIDRCAFFYELNIGWYEMYDPDYLDDRDPWNLSGRDPYYTYMMSNPEKIYVTKEDYDAMMRAINEPPKYIEGLANLMKRKLP